jgi:hypothetical protein
MEDLGAWTSPCCGTWSKSEGSRPENRGTTLTAFEGQLSDVNLPFGYRIGTPAAGQYLPFATGRFQAVHRLGSNPKFVGPAHFSKLLPERYETMQIKATVRVSMMLGVCSGLVLAAVYVWAGPLRGSHPSIWTLVWGATCYLCLVLLPLALLIGPMSGGKTWRSLRDGAYRKLFFATAMRFLLFLSTSGSIGLGTWYVLGSVR